MFKKNEYQESILSKIFKKTAKSHSLFQSQQQTQAIDIEEEDFRMSVNLLCVKGTSEKQRRILWSHKIWSTFYTDSILWNYFVNQKIK